MVKEGTGCMESRPVETKKTCANGRKFSLPGIQRAESVCKGRERHKIYKEEQDSSGVLKTDGPLVRAGIRAAGRKRRTGGDDSSG